MTEDFALDPEADDQVLLAQVVGYYHRALKASSEALDYLHGRGITSRHALEHFRLGFCDRSLGLKLPGPEVKAGKRIRARLQTLGVLRATGHEHFRGSITAPILAADGTGRIVDLYGRKRLESRLRKGTAVDVFLAEQRCGLWNVQAFARVPEVVLCPSLFDALVLWCHGYRNATWSFGLDRVTPDFLPALGEFQIRRVLTPCQALTTPLIAAGLEVFLVQLPVGMDISTLAQQADDPAQALGDLLRAAQWVGRGSPSCGVTVPFQPISQERTPDDAEPEEEEEDELGDADELDDPGQSLADWCQNDPPPARVASPVPVAPPDIEAEVSDDKVAMTFGNRRYRVRGLSKNTTLDVLRVNVLVSNGVGVHVDTFDLYSARHRRAFQDQAASELHVGAEVTKGDLGRLLLKLEELQDAHLRALLQPQLELQVMEPADQAKALELLRDPHVLDRVLADFPLVGERANKLVAYLAAVSRQLDQPLAVMVQSTSAAGKTALMEAVLAFMPPEAVVKYSALTGQSLYYLADGSLKHKILALVEDEGAQRASYALKLLQSEGELRIASTGKEVSTGRLVTQEYRVEGPVMLFLSTTSIQVDEELLNRCLVLTVDEGREQTRLIHQLQRRRETLQGQLDLQARQEKLQLHRNAQRLLRPLVVANPHAECLTFSDCKTRTRRDHQKYLTLIRAIALLHQYQRPIKVVEHLGHPVEYIEATLDDIALANELATEVLGRSLDELPPQTRRLLELLDQLVRDGCQHQGVGRHDYHFSRRQVRDFTGWGNTQLKLHLRRLVELEYLLLHRDKHSRRFVYELNYDGGKDEHGKVLPGLLDVERLRQAQRSGPSG
jgi:hypothetical protein